MEGLFNRRYLRVKVMQALYASQAASSDFEQTEKQMLKSMKETYDLLLYMLWLLVEVVEVERRHIERRRHKRVPTEEDLNPNTRFAENPVIAIIEENRQFKNLISSRKIDLSVESDNIIKIWRALHEDAVFLRYMASEQSGFQDAKEMLIYVFKNYIAVNEVFLDLFEDKNIYWYDDVQLVSIQVTKLLSGIKPTVKPDDPILPRLYKNEKEDLKFVRDLYWKTLLNSEEYTDMIASHTRNWDIERVAKLDVLIMKMALTEFIHFPELPVKVTMNEYLEIAKMYSTPKSRVFINGVLDNLLADLNSQGKIKKTGRGLINR